MTSQKIKQQSGLTLVELMVAMVIGLVLVGGVIQIFVANNQIYRVTDNMSRLQENSRFALDILSRTIRLAGFKDNGNTANLTAPFTLPAPAPFALAFTDAEQFISGTDATAPVAGPLDDADDITIRYRGASIGNPLIDCIGNPVGAGNEVISRFYLNGTTLTCLSSTNIVPQPLIDNVVSMQILYGMTDDPASNSANCYLPASTPAPDLSVDVSEPSLLLRNNPSMDCTTLNYNQVVSVRIKLLLATESAGLTSDGAAQTITAFDDDGANDIMVDSRLYRQLTQTISLRNYRTP